MEPGKQAALAMAGRAMAVAALAAGLALALPAAAKPKVVVSIAPIHSLVAGVMAGVGKPQMLVPPGASPHTFTLRPSLARALADADVVVWVGAEISPFLAKPLAALAGGARVVELAATPEMALLAARRGGAFEAPDNGHDGVDRAGHADDDVAAKPAGRRVGRDPHGAPAANQHIWLSPANARRIAGAVVKALRAVDPANTAAYGANAARLAARLDALAHELRSQLAPIATRPFVVFHDAYPYFEHAFGLTAAGSITVTPGHRPGPRRLAELRARIVALGARCVFAEPQFPAQLADTVVAGTGARIGKLDPIGLTLPPGADQYFALMRQLAGNFTTCLYVPPG